MCNGFLFFVLFGFVVSTACSKIEPVPTAQERNVIDEEAIQKYFVDNNKGYLVNNKQRFDSTDAGDPPFRFTLGRKEVISGWDEALVNFRVGEVGRIFIPSAQGYGAADRGANLPSFSNLVFEIKVVNAQ